MIRKLDQRPAWIRKLGQHDSETGPARIRKLDKHDSETGPARIRKLEKHDSETGMRADSETVIRKLGKWEGKETVAEAAHNRLGQEGKPQISD